LAAQLGLEDYLLSVQLGLEQGNAVITAVGLGHRW
jgi:hypothetical protein